MIVNIKVNGKAIKADDSKNLLLNLLDNGFEVPNLCYAQGMDVYGGCGLCIVEISTFPRPIRSCAVTPTEGLEVITESEKLAAGRKTALSLILSDHQGDCKAPCRNACPANQDCQGYVGLIANGDYKSAIRLIKQDNPLPASIGRVCPHPCEDACRRQLLEAPVSICSLKRFAADEDGFEYIPECEKSTGKTVAVIGAGPAGLSAAYFLARRGHAVEVFDAMPKAGGMLRYGIPAYRLPKDVLDKEIQVIEKLGVKFNYNMKLGTDITVASLRDKYNAVFVAVGAWLSSPLGCENDAVDGVLGGIDLLRDVAQGKRPGIGDRVAVVGGGNTAIDAVRTAVRLGAREVSLIYRRTRDEMPAEACEIEEAEQEGVRFIFLASPLSVIEKDGKAVGLRLQKMELGQPDASGRRSPVPVEGAVENVEFDTIISAIGQRVSSAGLDGLELTKKRTIASDEGTYMTSTDGVFAAGDAVNKGPGIAVAAIAGGKNAAAAIDSYLNGSLKPVIKPFLVERKNFTAEDIGDTEKKDRITTQLVDADTRRKSFSEVARTFTEDEARAEASRCLECGCGAYYDCKLLPLLQKYDANEAHISGKQRKNKPDNSNPFIWRVNNKCILCGLCIRSCKEKIGVEALGFDGRGFGTSAE
ncbi:MAG: FAD-dependent oxidoreductase, partial [Clostridiales bacterium]|nr:FAD-dependent oxidoreductase [Clostridiales bacterium]